jgi:hypothetical protein
MRKLFIEKIKKVVHDWAAQYPQVELYLIDVYPSGIGENLHLIVVAAKGFENWRQLAIREDLFTFLRKQLGDADVVRISKILPLTEEEYEQYELTRHETPVY